MPFSNLDAVMLVNEPPEFTYSGGLFHIKQRYSETCVIERVMRPSVFLLALRRAAEAARQHKFGGAQIIDFPASDSEEVKARH